MKKIPKSFVREYFPITCQMHKIACMVAASESDRMLEKADRERGRRANVGGVTQLVWSES